MGIPILPPLLLQGGPFDELLSSLKKLLPVIIFIGAALVPALKQARERKKHKQATRRSLEQTWERAQAETAPDPETERPPSAQSDLETRVRRYFENVAGEQSAAPAAKEPAAPRTLVQAGPAAPLGPALTHSLVEIDHLDLHLKHLDVNLKGLQRKPRKRLPSRMKRVRGKTAQRKSRSARPGGTSSLKSLLSSRATLKQAIVLREILGPPKALDD